MGLSLIAKIQWSTAVFLELSVLVLAVRGKLFRRHPLFTVYLGILLIQEVVIAMVYDAFGIRSYTAFYTFWALQTVLILCRGAAVYELCRVLLAPFVGIWKICRSFLLLTASTLAVSAYIAASESGPHVSLIISTAERGLELAIVGILLFGLAFCRYYQIRIERYILWMGLGFGFYSAVQVVNNSFLPHLLLSYFPLWNGLRVFSFNISTALWCFALWKPLPAPKLVPSILDSDTYESLSPRMNSRLRSLNAHLMEMWK